MINTIQEKLNFDVLKIKTSNIETFKYFKHLVKLG